MKIRDRINLLYSDTPFAFEENFVQISRYVDELRAAAHAALDEEAVLVVVLSVYHADTVPA